MSAAKKEPPAPLPTCENCGGTVHCDPHQNEPQWCNYCNGIRARCAEDGTVALLARIPSITTDPAQLVDLAIRTGEELARRLRGPKP